MFDEYRVRIKPRPDWAASYGTVVQKAYIAGVRWIPRLYIEARLDWATRWTAMQSAYIDSWSLSVLLCNENAADAANADDALIIFTC